MNTFKLVGRALSSVVLMLALAGCPSGDKCKDVTCPTGQSCNADTGTCGSGNGGGTGGNGGNGGSGGNGGGVVDAGPPPLALSQLCDQLVAATCDNAARCLQMEPADRPTCEAQTRAGCVDQVAKTNAGTFLYNGVHAQECLDGLKTAPCQALGNAACSKVFVGNGGPGAPCDSSSQCDAGYCRFGTAASSCDTCATYQTAGQPCGNGYRCQSGLSCFNPNLDGGSCRAPGHLGDQCTTSSDCSSDAGYCPSRPTDGGNPVRSCTTFIANGQPCPSDLSCVSTFCDYNDAGTRVCIPLPEVGQSCADTFDCAGGAICDYFGTQLCLAPNQPDGAPCQADEECANKHCNSNDGLPAGGKACGYNPLGQPCADHADCADGGLCKSYRPATDDAGVVPGTCALPDPDGAACTNETLRVDGTFPDSCANHAATCIGGTCSVTAPFSLPLDHECDLDGQCQAALFCDYQPPYYLDGTCKARKAAGEACFSDGECVDGVFCTYDGFFVTDGVCLAYKKLNEDCSGQDDRCQPYLSCESNKCVNYVATGQVCNNTTGPLCYDAFCSATAGMCVAKSSAGTACTSSAECATDRCYGADGGTATSTNPGSCLMACY